MTKTKSKPAPKKKTSRRSQPGKKGQEKKIAKSASDESSEAPATPNEQVKFVVRLLGTQIQKSAATGIPKAKPTEEIELHKLYDTGEVIRPPFDLFQVSQFPEYNSSLHGLVEAMEVNIDGFGHRLQPRVQIQSLPEDQRKTIAQEIAQEKLKLVNFFNNAYREDSGSFVSLRRKSRRDREVTGGAYWEVIRGLNTADVQYFNHVPSYQMRLARLDKEPIQIKLKLIMLRPDGLVEYKEVEAWKRFRRFVQVRYGYQKLVWFKEFGDPRVMDSRSGEYDPNTPKEFQATEIIYWKIYSSRTPYGVPRYMGNLLTIYGDRAADEVNYFTLSNNNIPSMIIAASGGRFTDGSIERIEEWLKLQAEDVRNYSRIIVVEVETEGEGGTGKFSFHPMKDTQIQDQMFLEYGKQNARKMQGNYRIPPAILGLVSDLKSDVVESSRRLADEQVFSPERGEFDAAMNRLIMAEKEAKYHIYVSNSPNVTDDKNLIAVLQAAERTGAMNPERATSIMEDILNKELPPIDPSKLDPHIPFSIQLAEHAKNTAFMTTGGYEPGSQITALKNAGLVFTLEDLEDLRNRVVDAIERA